MKTIFQKLIELVGYALAGVALFIMFGPLFIAGLAIPLQIIEIVYNLVKALFA
jgi:hypothetical protein